MASTSQPPKPNDRAGWTELLEQPTGYGHKQDCEWVATKAFQSTPLFRRRWQD